MTSRNNYNPPGLSNISYRVGTHASFLERMIEHLRRETIVTIDGQKLRPLANLRIRDKEDPAIALLDSWAMTLDVLSFYQERIANEGYLKTALERRSVMELVAAVGYKLAPGVAAGAFLVFRVDDSPGTYDEVKIPRGAKVMSVPKQQGAAPLVFETAYDFTGRRAWNDILICSLAQHLERISVKDVYVEGATAEIYPEWGSPELPSDEEILAKDDSGLSPETVKHQIEIFKAVTGRLPGPPPSEASSSMPIQSSNLSREKLLKVQTAFHRLDGVNTALRKGDLVLVTDPSNQWYVSRVQSAEAVHAKNYTAVQWRVPVGCRDMPTSAEVHAFRQRISLFGHSAPDWNGLSNREKLEQILNRKVSTAAFYADRLLAGASDGHIYSNSGGGKWTLFADLGTKAAVTAIATYRKPLPALNLVIASFVRPFSGLLLLNSGMEPAYRGNGENDRLKIALLKVLKSITVGGKSVPQLLSERRSRFPPRWRHLWLSLRDSRFASWSQLWQYDLHELALVMDAIIENSVMSEGNGETSFISPGSPLEALKSVVASFENACPFGKTLKTLFDNYEANLAGGFLAVGTAGDGVFFSENNGKTWLQNNDGLPNANIRGLAYDANGNLFAKTKEDTFLKLQGDKRWETNKTVTVYNGGGDDGTPYTGTQFTLGIGRYTRLKDEFKISAIDSMKISKGLKVTLNDYDDARAIKRTESFTENTPTVGTMNNRIDELIIERMSADVQFSDDPDDINRLLGTRLLSEWPEFNIGDDGTIDLDGDYPDILPDSWVVLVRDEETPALARVINTTTVFRRDFGVYGKVTRLKIAKNPDLYPERFSLRDTILYACSERLQPASIAAASDNGQGGGQNIVRVDQAALNLAKELDPDAVEALRQLDGAEGTLDELLKPILGENKWGAWASATTGITVRGKGLGLVPGQYLSVSGLDSDGNHQGEIVAVADVVERRDTTVLTLQEPIRKIYRFGTQLINANVVHATHGETVTEEVLGSGDATKPSQRFKLKRKPLTYITDSINTLEVRVNGVMWHEVDSLFSGDENAKVFGVNVDEGGNVTVIFGDGKHGARLPSGIENVTATYRVGSGLEGMPAPASLILPVNMPMGIRSVTNPEPATGGADPEDHRRTRGRLPRMEAPHDRILSLADYENFASSFPGVAKAQTHRLIINGRPTVNITVAGDHGTQITGTSKLAKTLLEAINRRVVFGQKTLIHSFKPLYFGLEAHTFYDPDHSRAEVEKRIRDALLDAFSFEKQDFGKIVAESDVVSIIQNVEGVVYTLFKGFSINGVMVAGPLIPSRATWNNDAQLVYPAELLLMKSEMSPVVLNLTARNDARMTIR